MGNFLITIGIFAIIFVATCLITAIIENFGYICRFIVAVVEVIGERICKAQVKYYKRKQHKRSREAERRHAIMLRMEREAQGNERS